MRLLMEPRVANRYCRSGSKWTRTRTRNWSRCVNTSDPVSQKSPVSWCHIRASRWPPVLPLTDVSEVSFWWRSLAVVWRFEFAEIDGEFIDNLKVLVPMILAPENLVLKRINGDKVKAKDFVQYCKSYMEIYKGNELPEPKSMLVVCVLMAHNLTACVHGVLSGHCGS